MGSHFHELQNRYGVQKKSNLEDVANVFKNVLGSKVRRHKVMTI